MCMTSPADNDINQQGKALKKGGCICFICTPQRYQPLQVKLFMGIWDMQQLCLKTFSAWIKKE